jgi:hypothetical protein
MNVSLQLTKTASSSNAGKTVMLRNIDMDTALAISASLRATPNANVEATLVIENLAPTKRSVRTARKPQKVGLIAGWLRSLRPAAAPALAR